MTLCFQDMRRMSLGFTVTAALCASLPVHAESPSTTTACRSDADCQRAAEDSSAVWCGPWNTCVSSLTSSCQSTQACRDSGHCTASEGRCVVGSDADCRRSKVCISEARCSVIAGACAITSSADCRAHQACRQSGLCSAVPDPKRPNTMTCRALTVEDCQLAACATRGLCALKAGRCVPSKREHCEGSMICRERGRCALIKARFGHQSRCGFGAKADAECRQARGTLGYVPCEEDGLCTVRRGVCQATEPDHCQWSTVCKEEERCQLDVKVGACFTVASDSGCQGSEACAERGECVYQGGGMCAPKRSEHCAQSQGCKTDGACRFDSVERRCVKD